ncbi:hypothetical protein QNI16_37910 [Cytophagaceae bacterium YF14B1]|uniref:Lipoprotein n=1 Tax=Xanthocytophaga flava TaxID=3048013 RepID=A0AAE3UC07_9BACT|nr:hypothetical protein [Xanthocytophaga flavus]MDJ1486317.1 hypothetical protein [Xanthocytophaga flavus]
MWRSLNSITLLWLFSGCMDVKTTTDTKELVCDSLIYSLDNRISENAIDSLVRGKTVVFCVFSSSSYKDTLELRLTLSNEFDSTDVHYFRNRYRTNRFLKIKNKKIMVLSTEDFALQKVSPGIHKELIGHPASLVIDLAYHSHELLNYYYPFSIVQ